MIQSNLLYLDGDGVSAQEKGAQSHMIVLWNLFNSAMSHEFAKGLLFELQRWNKYYCHWREESERFKVDPYKGAYNEEGELL